MTETNSESADSDELLELLESTMSAFVITKRRYLLLAAALRELERVERYVADNESGNPATPVNDAVLQMLRDSFDMLVIDLASIRENMIERKGLLGRLKDDFCSRLRRCDPDDLAPRKIIVWGGDSKSHDALRATQDIYERREIANGVNAVLERLFPGEYPVMPTGVAALIARFIRDTEAIDKDRNHVRAHRYEHRPFDRNRYFCPPDAVGKHLEAIERYLVDLYLVLTRSSYHATLDFDAGAKHVAEDLADLIVHGSINRAVDAYGMSKRTTENPRPWYWAHRQACLGPKKLES